MTIGRRSEPCLVYVMEGALARLRKSSISIKDMANQTWCEKQMELYMLYGMFSTPAMEKGKAIHYKMEVKEHVPLTVEPKTPSDRFYKTLYENYVNLGILLEKGKCREIKIYGSINGFKVVGQIDELRIEGGKTMVVEDKTKNGENSGNIRMLQDSLQVMLYRKVLDDLVCGSFSYDNFANSYRIYDSKLSREFYDGLKSQGMKEGSMTIDGISKLLFERLKSLPEVAETLELRYFDRKDNSLLSTINIKYDNDYLNKELKHLMGYWSGSREASPVPEAEKWKCKWCRFFGNKCTVWYNK